MDLGGERFGTAAPGARSISNSLVSTVRCRILSSLNIHFNSLPRLGYRIYVLLLPCRCRINTPGYQSAATSGCHRDQGVPRVLLALATSLGFLKLRPNSHSVLTTSSHPRRSLTLHFSVMSGCTCIQ